MVLIITNIVAVYNKKLLSIVDFDKVETKLSLHPYESYVQKYLSICSEQLNITFIYMQELLFIGMQKEVNVIY